MGIFRTIQKQKRIELDIFQDLTSAGNGQCLRIRTFLFIARINQQANSEIMSNILIFFLFIATDKYIL